MQAGDGHERGVLRMPPESVRDQCPSPRELPSPNRSVVASDADFLEGATSAVECMQSNFCFSNMNPYCTNCMFVMPPQSQNCFQCVPGTLSNTWMQAVAAPQASVGNCLQESSSVPVQKAKPSNQQHAKSMERTTLMLRNIPNDYSRDMLLELLDAQGFAARYDFLYLPVDFKRMAGLGYAFVNCASEVDAEQMMATFHGFRQWRFNSAKVCEVVWGEPLQGLRAHVDRYRNSPVMHGSVPDSCKPAMFENGVRKPFPAPTKRIRAPRR